MEISDRIARGKKVKEQVGQALAVQAALAKSKEQEKVRKGGPQFWQEFRSELAANVQALSTIQLIGTLKMSTGTKGDEIVYIQILEKGPIPRMTDAELRYRPGDLVVQYQPLHGEPGEFPVNVALEGWIGLVLDGRDPSTAKDAAAWIVRRMTLVLNPALPSVS